MDKRVRWRAGDAGDQPAAETAWDSRTLARLLVYGTRETRRSLAEGLAGESGRGSWSLLAATVCSEEPWRLRARCLEVLGLAAGSGGRDVAESILEALLLEARARGG